MISKNEVKYIRSLGQQKGRQEAGVFLAEGTKIISEMILRCPERIEKIYATKQFVDSNLHATKGVSMLEVDESMLGRLSQMQHPNQVLAVVKKLDYPPPAYDSKEWMLFLDGLQDPGNLGTIIREADWFGIKHILCTSDTADYYNGKVVQASMGSVLRVGLHIVEKDWIHQYKGPVIGTMLDGEPIHHFSFPPYGLLVIGREGSGIRDEIRSVMTHSISIPSYGHAESLNAAVATGILLWEWRRRQ